MREITIETVQQEAALRAERQLRQATGFLATDNTFFATEAECLQYEAIEEIKRWCVSHTPPYRYGNILHIIDQLAPTILEYLYATKDIADAARQETELAAAVDEGEQQEQPGSEQDDPTAGSVGNSDEAEVDQHQAFDGATEGESQAVQQQPFDRYEPVSDMGSGSRTEAVRVERKGNGPRGRRGNASGFRSGKGVST